MIGNNISQGHFSFFVIVLDASAIPTNYFEIIINARSGHMS